MLYKQTAVRHCLHVFIRHSSSCTFIHEITLGCLCYLCFYKYLCSKMVKQWLQLVIFFSHNASSTDVCLNNLYLKWRYVEIQSLPLLQNMKKLPRIAYKDTFILLQCTFRKHKWTLQWHYGIFNTIIWIFQYTVILDMWAYLNEIGSEARKQWFTRTSMGKDVVSSTKSIIPL